jgi:hypothetical protein
VSATSTRAEVAVTSSSRATPAPSVVIRSVRPSKLKTTSRPPSGTPSSSTYWTSKNVVRGGAETAGAREATVRAGAAGPELAGGAVTLSGAATGSFGPGTLKASSRPSSKALSSTGRT